VCIFHVSVIFPVELCSSLMCRLRGLIYQLALGSSIATHLRPLFLGCCEKDDLSGIEIHLSFISRIKMIIGIFIFG
jgi:hypothetical protein